MKNSNRKLKFISGLFRALLALFWVSFVIGGFYALLNVFFHFGSTQLNLEFLGVKEVNIGYKFFANPSFQGGKHIAFMIDKLHVDSFGYRLFDFLYFVIEMGSYLLIFHYAKSIFDSLHNSICGGNPFMAENSVRIRKIGWLVLFIGVFQFVASSVFSLFFVSDFQINGEVFSLYPTPKVIRSIFISIILFIIAEVYATGVKMREESELTI